MSLPALAWMFFHCGLSSLAGKATVFHYPSLSQFSMSPGLEWSSVAWCGARLPTTPVPALHWTVSSIRIPPGLPQGCLQLFAAAWSQTSTQIVRAWNTGALSYVNLPLNARALGTTHRTKSHY